MELTILPLPLSLLRRPLSGATHEQSRVPRATFPEPSVASSDLHEPPDSSARERAQGCRAPWEWPLPPWAKPPRATAGAGRPQAAASCAQQLGHHFFWPNTPSQQHGHRILFGLIHLAE